MSREEGAKALASLGAAEQARRLFLASTWIKPPPGILEYARKFASAPVWQEAAAAARRTSQEPLFYHFVKRHCSQAPLSLEMRSELETQNRYHAFHWEEIRECLEVVVESLHEKQIRPILLKGISCVGDCYHLPRLRPMRDIDLLVKPEEVEAARDALLGWGFVRKDEASEKKYERHHHLPPLFHPENGTCVELHHHPLSSRARAAGSPTLEEFWSDLRDCSVEATHTASGRAAVLAPHLQLLVTCLHFSHSDHIVWRVSHVIDILRMVELHENSIDWDRLLFYATSPELALSLALPFLFLEGEDLPTAPAAVRDELTSRSRLRWWERRLLVGLVNRYRLGLPRPWTRVSGRVANIVWEQLFRRTSSAGRVLTTIRRVLDRGRVPPSQLQRARAE